jgi:hypothetical protein
MWYGGLEVYSQLVLHLGLNRVNGQIYLPSVALPQELGTAWFVRMGLDS